MWEVIDAASLASLREFKVGVPVRSIFATDSAFLRFGYADDVVCRFKVEQGTADMTFQAHDLHVRSIAINRDGTRLATASGDDG